MESFVLSDYAALRWITPLPSHGLHASPLAS
jgi:hypothetical protein